jgi:hypothetical protein
MCFQVLAVFLIPFSWVCTIIEMADDKEQSKGFALFLLQAQQNCS